MFKNKKVGYQFEGVGEMNFLVDEQTSDAHLGRAGQRGRRMEGRLKLVHLHKM